MTFRIRRGRFSATCVFNVIMIQITVVEQSCSDENWTSNLLYHGTELSDVSRTLCIRDLILFKAYRSNTNQNLPIQIKIFQIQRHEIY